MIKIEELYKLHNKRVNINIFHPANPKKQSSFAYKKA